MYDIGSVSNRNIQLLYLYRILREPSDRLTAICRGGPHTEVFELNWELCDAEIPGYDTVYKAVLDGVVREPNTVPFLEFKPEDEDWRWIADFIGVDADDEQTVLYSATNHLTSLPISVYWCYSLRHVDSVLTDILRDLKGLADDYAAFGDLVRSFKDNGSYLTRPEGMVPNLVKIQNTGSSSGLVDSTYRIRTPESNRLWVNQSQANLDTMEHVFNEAVEFRFLEAEHYVVDDFTAPVIIISGKGDLVLKNLTGQVLVHNWVGTLTVVDCTEVHLTADDEDDICKLTRMQITKGSVVYLENHIHQIEVLEMRATSICRHWRANVGHLSYVGPGCVYWCCAKVSVPGRVQLEFYEPASNTVFDFAVHDIIGAFISDFDNIMILGQKNLTPRLGNCDPEPPPGLYVPQWMANYNTIIPGGDGDGQLTQITIEGLTCWLWMPDRHDNVGLTLCVPGYRGGITEATQDYGAWCAVELVKPRSACLFLQRPANYSLPSRAAVMDTIAQIQGIQSLGTNLWYHGFSQGANDFDTVCHWAQFKGAVLVDANSIGFSTTGLEKVMAVQGMFNFASQYNAKLGGLGIDYKLYDYHGQASHANVNYWTPSDSDATYRQIAGGYYTPLPDNPPNSLVWLCGGRAMR